MDQIMKIEEIEKHFDSEWVLLDEPQTDEQLNILGGKVVYHNSDKITFDREVLKLKPHPKHFAVLFIGEPAEEMEYVL